MKLPHKLPDGWSIDSRTQYPIADPFYIVSFYSDNYRDLTDAWISSLNWAGHLHQGLLISVGEIEDWREGTFLKPKVIRWALELGHPVLWADVDARFLKPVPELQRIQADVGVHVEKDSPHGGSWWSGTLYLNPTRPTAEMLDEWIAILDNPLVKDRLDGDQEALGMAMKNIEEVTIHNLPTRYVNIPRFHSDEKDPSITHLQASRKRRNTNRGEVTTWFPPANRFVNSSPPTSGSTP